MLFANVVRPVGVPSSSSIRRTVTQMIIHFTVILARQARFRSILRVAVDVGIHPRTVHAVVTARLLGGIHVRLVLLGGFSILKIFHCHFPALIRRFHFAVHRDIVGHVFRIALLHIRAVLEADIAGRNLQIRRTATAVFVRRQVLFTVDYLRLYWRCHNARPPPSLLLHLKKRKNNTPLRKNKMNEKKT